MIRGDNMTEPIIASCLDVVYEYVYNGIKCGPHTGNLSALIVTSSGDVYGAGANTLIRSYMHFGEFPMKEGQGPVLSSWVKIDHLSGIRVRKIIVGEGFGAALTDDRLLTWGYGMRSFLGEQAVVMFQEYQEDTRCTLCTLPHDYYTSPEVENQQSSLSYCNVTNEHPIYTSEYPPPSNVPVIKFLRFNAGVIMKCSQCMRTMSSKLVNSIPLFHCPSCNITWEMVENVGNLGREPGIFSSILRNIMDIAPYSSGIWMLLPGNELMWRSFEKRPAWVEFPAKTHDSLKIKAIYAGAQILVTSCTDNLYRVNPRTYVLEEIPLPSFVAKICCGFHSVACLLADKSIWVLAGSVPPLKLETDDGETLFQDISCAQWYDVYYVNCIHIASNHSSLVNIIDPDAIRNISFKLISHDSCRVTLLNTVCAQRILMSSTAVQSTPSKFSHHKITLPPFQVELYGRKYLSDMTLKLSNEEFPAHRCVLLSTSRYFNKILLSNTDPHVTLDMTSFNPKAYKCLLKYYYQVEPDDLDLDVDGWLDLYVLADSYEETDMLGILEKKMCTKINTENVLHVFAMSKLMNIEQVKMYCEHLMRSSTFKEMLLEQAIQDPMMFMVLLK